MKIAKIITGVIVVLIVALAVGLVFKFTNGFNEDFKTFYLERDGKQILTSETETSFTCGESYRYEVKYTFDNDKSEPKGYNVKIVPNGKIQLSFKADLISRKKRAHSRSPCPKSSRSKACWKRCTARR